MINFFKNIFIWWHRQTIGTMLYTLFFGKLVGKDQFGYKYYSADKARKLIGWSPRYTIKDSLKEIFIHSMSSSKF